MLPYREDICFKTMGGVVHEEGLACVCRERGASPAARLCGFRAKLQTWRSRECQPHGNR